MFASLPRRITETVERLPAGRHGLTREEVESSQRARILRAIAEAVAERGYVDTPVAEVLRRARVSRETFDEHFANREDCFLAAYDAGVALVLSAMGDVVGDEETTTDVVLNRTLERYLATLASEPAVARTFMVEVYGAGEAALARRVEVQSRFAEQIAEWVGARSADDRFACEAVVATVIGLVTQWICAGRVLELPELHAPLMRHAQLVLQSDDLDPRPALMKALCERGADPAARP